MSGTLFLVCVIIVVALVFDYINGFHDAANSIATVVATRVLTPLQAVVWAAFFNFVAAIPLFFGEAGVASTVGKGMVNLDVVTPHRDSRGIAGCGVLESAHLVLRHPFQQFTCPDGRLRRGRYGQGRNHPGLVPRSRGHG